jgi:tetratricopeptide (TPR) repeat protein
MRRNQDFESDTRLWTAEVAQRPKNPRAHNNLGSALVQAGRVEESLPHFEAAIRYAPDYSPAHRNLGAALVRLGRSRDAIAPIREALRLDPNDGMTHYKLGQALQVAGDRAGAIASYETALRLSPNLVMAHQNLGIARMQAGEFGAARKDLEAALALDPDHIGSLNNMAWLLATCPDATVRDGALAVRYAERAARLGGEKDPVVMDTLAAAYAEAGRFDAAVETLTRLQARVAGDPSAPHEKLAKCLQLYTSGRPYRMGL